MTSGGKAARQSHEEGEHRGTVLKTSLSKDDEKELQDVLHGSGTAAQ